MMKQLRGRNLAHPGCLIGVVLGLILGIILAGVLATTTSLSYTSVTMIWFGLVFLLGVAGWIAGTLLTVKNPSLSDSVGGEESRHDATHAR